MDSSKRKVSRTIQYRICSHEGCTHVAKANLLCISHGGGLRCKIPNCRSGAKKGGLCVRHGGGQRCSISECPMAAQTRPLCQFHGGTYRCKSSECIIFKPAIGLCTQHGKKAYVEFLSQDKKKSNAGASAITNLEMKVPNEREEGLRRPSLTSSSTSASATKTEGEARDRLDLPKQIPDLTSYSPVSQWQMVDRQQSMKNPNYEILPCKFSGCFRIAREGGYCAAHSTEYDVLLPIASKRNRK